jgi:hypothetical protein
VTIIGGSAAYTDASVPPIPKSIITPKKHQSNPGAHVEKSDERDGLFMSYYLLKL